MIIVRGADKLIIRNIEHVTKPSDNACDTIHKRFRRNARFRRLQLNFLSVLVRSCLEKDVVSVLSLIAGDTVRQHDFIIIPDMRLA